MHMIYELLYILPSQYSETEIEGIVKKVSALVEKVGAKVEKSETLGKIKLAYPINKMRHGTYILSYISIENKEGLVKLETDLKHSDEVMRHILVRREEGIPVHPVRLTSYQAPLNSEGKRTATAEVPKQVQKKETASKEKLSTKELDKQLDDILENDITEKV